MSTRISSKEILAKLMAKENILVEHANVPTAGFDLINRKLLLPNWKNISDDVYTLLISHEVGHALYTPKDEWEKEIIKHANVDFKQVVNIVEDVRIEKMIQNLYPGTVRAFRAGYNELEKSNLFGTKDRDIESYGLLDRLNLHFKIGHFGYAKVPFSEAEMPWLDKISACKTFSDVIKIATELKQFVEENPESQGDKQAQSEQNSSDNLESKDMSNSSNSPSSQQGGSQSQSSEQFGKSDDVQQSSSNGTNNQTSSDNTTNNDSGEGSETESAERPKVFSETQSHFDSEIQKLVDTSVLETFYANVPKIQLDKLVVDYKTVHQQITNFYSKHYPQIYDNLQADVERFKNVNKNTVNQLANLFEMKKKAKLDVRSLTSRTGKLDTNKVYSYRYNDDIFKKLTITPQGKSHGLVMFIDMSSSMTENIAGTYEQLLNLVLFCRRVNIPFDVYGFTDAYASRQGLQKHPSVPGELMFHDSFCLRHYFSNTMSGNEFNVALKNIICIMRHYTGQYYGGVPPQETLNTTPMVPAILAATQLVKEFREKYRLDIVNTIFLTDGEDTHGLVCNDGTGQEKYIGTSRRFGWNASKLNHYIRDSKTRKQWQIKNCTADMLNILRETNGVKVIGFHIIKKRELSYILERTESNTKELNKHLDNFKNNKFCELNNVSGYDAYYMIPAGHTLSIGSDDFEGDVDTTIDWDDQKQVKKTLKAVTKNFSNFMKQKMTNRILLNRFIDHIS